MDYEDLLLNLVSLSMIPESRMTGYFDTRLVALIFKGLDSVSALPIPLRRKYPPQAFSVKRISGDLDRLFKMGLLKRKRVKRVLKASDGKEFGRGYMYQYKISAQGMNYAHYLATDKNFWREERRRNRCRGYWSEDERDVQILARSGASVAAVELIADNRKRSLSAGKRTTQRFSVHFDYQVYERYLAERMLRIRAEIRQKMASAEAENAKYEARIANEIKNLHENQTPLAHILLALVSLKKQGIDPEIYPKGARKLAAIGQVSKIESIPLSRLLNLIISELYCMGYKAWS